MTEEKKSTLADFLGTKCSGCGGAKRSRMSHCRRCYYWLPPTMRQALYRRFGQGYEEAFTASVEYLRKLPVEQRARA
jgi:hypothetical protein